MYKKILVPLDGSRRAETVLPYVRELDELANAEIVLMSVAVDSIGDTLFRRPKLAAATAGTEEVAANAKGCLEHVVATFEKTGVKVSTRITHGLVAEAILDSAQKIHADLIVMSTWRSRPTRPSARWQYGIPSGAPLKGASALDVPYANHRISD